MPMRFIILLMALMLTGCETSKPSGNALGGVIDDVQNGAYAYKRASEHCTAFRKSAKITQLSGETAAFECI